MSTAFERFLARGPFAREDLKNPFVVGDWEVAADRCRAIWRPLRGDGSSCPSGEVFDVITGLIDAWSDDGFSPMAAVEMPQRVDCAACNGVGKTSTIDCQECDGEGELILESGYNRYLVDCKGCDGGGNVTIAGGDEDCQDCHGIGLVYSDSSSVEVLGIKLNPDFLADIADAPGLEVKPGDMRLFFRAGEYRGVILGWAR